MRKLIFLGWLAAMMGVLFMSTQGMAQNKPADADTFYQSTEVIVEKVTFTNQYAMNVVGNLYLPKKLKQAKNIPRSLWGIPWAQ